jgi:glucose-6-phosphate dehydrogenase assembly protein OpcA
MAMEIWHQLSIFRHTIVTPAMIDEQETILLAPAREVDVTAIERELVQLWKQAAGGNSPGESPIVRACTINLILFSAVGRSFGLDDIINRISIDHPGRLFLVSADQNATDDLDAWVSARCSLPVPGGKQVCCEEIHLVARGAGLAKVPHVITSLLVPDIPTVLIWKADPDARDPMFLALARLADRALIDSSDDLHVVSSLSGWGGFIADNPGRIAFGDLAWAHCARWRSMLAQSFQPEHMRVHLDGIVELDLEYSVTLDPLHSGLSQALLVSAWLAHALQWKPPGTLRQLQDGACALIFQKGDREVRVGITKRERNGNHPGGLESLRVRTERGGELTCRVLDETGCCQLRCSFDGKVTEERVQSLHQKSEAELVSQELEILYNDPAFESAMSVVSQFLGDRS